MTMGIIRDTMVMAGTRKVMIMIKVTGGIVIIETVTTMMTMMIKFDHLLERRYQYLTNLNNRQMAVIFWDELYEAVRPWHSLLSSLSKCSFVLFAKLLFHIAWLWWKDLIPDGSRQSQDKEGDNPPFAFVTVHGWSLFNGRVGAASSMCAYKFRTYCAYS